MACTNLDCDNKDSLESLLKQLIIEREDGSLALRVTCCEPEPEPEPPEPLPFRMLIDTKANADTMIGGDSASVADWNTFFGAGNMGTPFNNIALSNLPTGCQIDLFGGANIKLRDYVFGDNDPSGTSLLEVDDQLECVIECGEGVFSDYNTGSGCYAVTKIHLPVCETLGDWVFVDCQSLTDIILSDNITTLPILSFSGCILLQNINMPNVVDIGESCFSGCTALADQPFITQLTSIGEGAFASCESLTNPILNIAMTSLNKGVFNGCTGLINPNFITQIVTAGQGCFGSCTGFINPTFTLLETAGVGCFAGCTGLINPNFPALTTTGTNCFMGCSSLNHPLFPSLITGGWTSFTYCENMTTISLPSLISAGFQFLEYCHSLTSIGLPVCTDLGTSTGNDGVFQGITTNIITLTIPHALESDGDIVYLKANNTVTVLYSD